jgi:hypothetical protein
MTASYTEVFGSGATFGTDGTGTWVKFYLDPLVALTGITPSSANSANGADKTLSALIIFNALRTYTEGHSVVLTKSTIPLQVAQRNASAKWKQDYSISVYQTATGIPTAIDPDDV